MLCRILWTADKRAIEDTKQENSFGSQIRNYVMHPYQLVKDLRTDEETSNINAVMDGEIDAFIKAFLLAQPGVAGELATA